MKLICGIDECGRGPLAGPVTAAACAYFNTLPKGLADSKTLNEKKRHFLEQELRNHSTAFFAIGWVSPDIIDRINIHYASLLAMQRAYHAMLSLLSHDHYISHVLVDGRFTPSIPVSSTAIVQGDSKIACIQAASIIAKNARDMLMKKYAGIFPHYAFEQHKGYPTKQHINNIKQFGTCSIHRQSFCKKY